MVNDLNGSTRRILTFPAVNPCESIAPATLLNSLISLAHTITSRNSNLFATNTRNAREIIREIAVVLVILEEIRSDKGGPPESAVLGLSELHVTFQKVRYLLEDCTRPGARLWMLVHSGRVANHFRVSGRAISTALDVLPLGSIGVSGEAREAIDLVLKQSRRARFDLEASDRRASDDVTAILNRFEDGVEPDRSDLMRVLDFAGIRSRSDCDREVRFLDSEIGLDWSSHEHNKAELELLSSLMGFVTFSRCVLFDVAGGESHAGRFTCCESGSLNCLNPDDFRCPISLEWMTNPVTISTGHTYDRSSILKWFGAGNPICPKTGERLKNTDFVPNLSLRRLIQQYCSQNNIQYLIPEMGRRNHDVTRTVLAGSSAAEGAIKMAAKLIAFRLKSGTEEERNRAAHEVRVLAKASIFNRSCLIDSGAIPHLLNLLTSTSSSSSSQEHAMAALLNLSKHQKSRAVVANNNGLKHIVHVLQHGLKIEARHHAAATIFYLSSIKEYSKSIGEIQEAIPGLLALIKGSSDRGKKNSLVALFGLLSHPHNHSKILALGAVPLLISLSTLDREDLVTDCLAILARLAEKPEGSVAVLRHGAVDRTLEVLSGSSSKAAREHCVSLLLGVCVNCGGDVVGVLAKSSILMGSLYSMLSDGTSRGSRKARDLIRVLHGYFERRSVGEIGLRPLPYEEQAVHAW